MVLIFFLTGGSVKQVFKPPDLSPCVKHRGGPACVILGVAVLACRVSYSRRVLILIEHEWCRHVLQCLGWRVATKRAGLGGVGHTHREVPRVVYLLGLLLRGPLFCVLDGVH